LRGGPRREDWFMETNKEHALRRKIGAPAEAERVLVLGESSHWDPNWLLTSEQYYRLRVKRIMDQVILALDAEPERVFSIECVFFLRMYFERSILEKREKVVELVNSGRLRLTGSGVTTPDTLLPLTEAVIRDYLIGQEWLRENGMEQEPTLAYLPDDFGHSPGLPAILASLGFDKAAVTRIDGSFFPGADYRRRSYFPRPGSSAELLARDLRTADFVWSSPDGSKVLCHWNPYTYFQGDAIALAGFARWMGLSIGLPKRSARHTAERIAGYVKQLAPLARTPYMFCPIGCDFNGPVKRLLELLDRYNSTAYQDTGVYAVNAGLDDYLELVGCHKEALPQLGLDMNPYWMGFYASRPEMKKRCRKLVRDLVTAEKLAALSRGFGKELMDDLEKAWYTAAVSNHHDFITGTSPDRVWKREQKPWLEKAQERADRALRAAQRSGPPPPGAPPAGRLEWRLEQGVLEARTADYRIKLEACRGGCITSFQDASGREYLAGPGFDAVSCRDEGGLWRMGHEYAGGRFDPGPRASRAPAEISAAERGGVLEAEVVSKLDGRRLVRKLWMRPDSAAVRMRVIGSAAKRRTVTLRFATSLAFDHLEMDVPGAVVCRPLVKVFDPTFWAAESFAHLRDRDGLHGLAFFMDAPACISAGASGAVELAVVRNAPKERAFGFLPVLGHPAYGEDPDEHAVDCAMMITTEGDWLYNGLRRMARAALSPCFIKPSAPEAEGQAEACFAVGGGVEVLAIKPAHRGEGLIVRLYRLDPSLSEARLSCPWPIGSATLCDARERDIYALSTNGESLKAPLKGALTSVRIIRS